MSNIILIEDKEAEIDLFLNFLDNKQYPQHRNIIFLHFPELKEKINLSDTNKENQRIIIKKFLENLKRDNKDNLIKSIAFIKNEIEKYGEKTLKILFNLMDYKQIDDKNYFLLPTIYPLCPFKNRTIFYSIYESLNGVTEHPKVLPVSAHEISHMILFEILEKEKIKLGQQLLYFIKELIAPILVYQDDFKGIFKKQIVGNYNVLEIYLQSNGKTIKAFDYFLEMFVPNRSEGKNFISFLNQMVDICKNIESAIKEKREFDNRHGILIMKDERLLTEFREPIKLD